MTLYCMVVFAFFVIKGNSYPLGPPTSVCDTLMPGSAHGDKVLSGNGGFKIATNLAINSGGGFYYEAGKTYTGTHNYA